MHTVTSFRSTDLAAAQTGALISEYLAFEQARRYRRLCQAPAAALALAFAVAGPLLHWLSPSASWSGVGLTLTVPAWAWISEVRRDFRLTRTLSRLPAGSAEVTICEPRKS